MMGVLHGNSFHIKTVFLCKLAYTCTIVISHQEITGKFVCDTKKLLVIQFVTNIQACSRSFTGGSVRWIDKMDCIITMSIATQYFKPVSMNKSESVSYGYDIENTLADRFRIPS